MHRRLTLLAVLACFLVSWGGPACAQSTEEAARLIAAAEQKIADQDAVGATLLLWRAETLLDPTADDSGSKAIAGSIARLLGRIDPLDGQRRAARTEVAEQMVKFAQRYTRRRWFRSAYRLLQRAAAFDVEVAAKPLAYAAKKVEGLEGAAAKEEPEAEADESASERPLLASVQTMMVNGAWEYADGVLRSPEIEADETPVYLCSSPSVLDGEVQVDLQIGKVEGAAALVFGVQGLEDYFLLEVWQHGADGASNLTIYHFDFDGQNRAATQIARGFVLADKTRAERFATLSLRIEGDRVRASFDGSKPVDARLPRRGVGGIGFLVPGNTPFKQPVAFRNLRVGPLTEDGQPAEEQAAQPGPSQPVLGAIAVAEAHFGAGDDEDGVFALRGARELLPAIESRTLRDTLREQIEALADEHDPLRGEAREVEKEIGAVWGGLAGRYLEAGRKRLAWELFRTAAELDAETWQPRVEDLEVELAVELAKERGLAAEPQAQSLSNDLLVGAFEAARQYWTLEPWRLVEGGLSAPRLEPDNSAMLLFDAASSPGQRAVSVRGRRAEGHGDFGLIFGAKSAYDLHVLVVSYGDPNGEVAVWRLESEAWKEVVRRKVHFDPRARAQWTTLRVEQLEGGKVRCRVGTDAVFECAVGGELPSRYGLFSGVNPNLKESARAEFAGLRWAFDD